MVRNLSRIQLCYSSALHSVDGGHQMLFSWCLGLESIRRLYSHAWCLDRNVGKTGLSWTLLPLHGFPGPFHMVSPTEHLAFLPGSSTPQETRVEAAILSKPRCRVAIVSILPYSVVGTGIGQPRFKEKGCRLYLSIEVPKKW